MAKSVARAARASTNANQREASRRSKRAASGKSWSSADSFQNIAARVGLGTDNQAAQGNYGYNPITNNRMTLDFAYRSSWICRAVVQGRAKDMVRAGIDFESDIDPNDADRLHVLLNNRVWSPLRKAIQWGRLYGGSIAYIMIDGQRPDTPLQLDRIPQGAFKGLLPLDRWQLQPTLSDLVEDMNSDQFGKPKYYQTISTGTILRGSVRIHHSRVIRFEGDDLPYYQTLTTMLWGMSILEPVWDRLLAFDSTTQGIAQMVYRASMRNLYIENWKETVAAGGKRLDAQLSAIDNQRRWMGNEGISIFDSKDKFEALSYAFTGLDSVLIQMGQQLAGATRYPLVILFGQSPTGFSATGESDIRMYYDSVATDQQDIVRPGLDSVLRIAAASEGIRIADDFAWKFNPLLQLYDEQKATIGSQNTSTIAMAFEGGLIGRKTALQELKQQSRETGMWTNITEEQIDDAEEDPPAPSDLGEATGSLSASPETFLPKQSPAGEEGSPDSFLPRRGFLPAGARDPEDDSVGAFERGETERYDRKPYKPLVHIHHPQGTKSGMLRLHLADTNLPGRETEFCGHRVVVEVERGQARTMGASGGAILAYPYGYFPLTRGNDGDCVDVFLGDNDKSNVVFVADQVNPDTKEFHQHKIGLGMRNSAEFLKAFQSFYADGRANDRLGTVREMTLPAFGDWLNRYRIKSVAA